MKNYKFGVKRNIILNIGYFFLEQKKGNYNDTYKLLDLMGITGVQYKKRFFKKDIIKIKLNRPGILIGKQGTQLKALKSCIEKFLGKGVTILLREDTLKNLLYPIDYQGYYE